MPITLSEKCSHCKIFDTCVFIGICTKCEYLWRIQNISIINMDNNKKVIKNK